ncbi:uncharacterized protein METZ01_LOCUS235820, partial [marine metagenome]
MFDMTLNISLRIALLYITCCKYL